MKKIMNLSSMTEKIIIAIILVVSTLSLCADTVPTQGMVLWLDADTGIAVDSNGRVADWADRSHARNHASQQQIQNQPILKTQQLHNKPAVVFDGKNDYLQIPDLKIPRDTTIFIVSQDIEQRPGGSVYRPLILADNDPFQMITDGYGIGYKKGDNPGLIAVLSDNDYWDNFKLTKEPSEKFEILTFYKQQSDAYLYRNGFRRAHGILNRHTKGDDLPFHRGYLLGAWKGPNAPERAYKGGIAEVIVYERALPESEKFAVLQYLSKKYGIPVKEAPVIQGLAAWLKPQKTPGRCLLEDHSLSGAAFEQAGSQYRDIPWKENIVHGHPGFFLRPLDYIDVKLSENKDMQALFVAFLHPLEPDSLPQLKTICFTGDQLTEKTVLNQFRLEKRSPRHIRLYAHGSEPLAVTEILAYDQNLTQAQLDQTRRYLELRYLVRQDPRYVKNGTYIFSSGYADQPYITKLKDDSWLCVITTSPDIESSPDRHTVLTRSFDQGKTWTTAVPAIEDPFERRQPSWSTMFTTDFGRVYVFYNLAKENRKGMNFCYKYSDDMGHTWSQRYLMPIPELDIDRKFKRGIGSWSIDEPEIIDNALYISWTKFGGPDRRGEGFFFRSDNILYEKDAEKLQWKMYPKGGKGIHNDSLSPLQEEHNIVPLGGDDIYCVFRTLDGYAGHAYSRDGGKTWSMPVHATYTPGGKQRIKTPRACPRVFRCQNGKFLLWFHNHDGRDVPARNKDRDFVWLAGGILDDKGFIHWSQPELFLYGYDFQHDSGMSYPDLVEEEGKYWFTETQKVIARIHSVDPAFLQAMWDQYGNNILTTAGLVYKYDTAGSTTPSRIILPDLLQGGLSVDIVFTLESLAPGQVLMESGGITLETGEKNDICIRLDDGIHPVQSWSSDSGLIKPDSRHHVTFIVDGRADIISVLVDGVLCDGGEARKYGWKKFSPELRAVCQRAPVTIAPRLDGTVHSVRLYDRALLTSEAVGNYNALK